MARIELDQIDRDVIWAIESAMDDLCNELDQIAQRAGLSDEQVVQRLAGWPDLAEAYSNWAAEGGEG